MTANSITIAAHTEAVYRDMDPSVAGKNNRAWFVAGAEWGYEQALTQEPTDAEVRAGAHEIHVLRARLEGSPVSSHTLFDEDLARAALSTARATRRDKETR